MISQWFRRRRYLRFTRHVAVAIRRRLARVAALFALLFLAHTAAMMTFEGLPLGDALWLSITTATTVGYGDLSANTPAGRAATTVCMYLLGIFLLAQAASDLFEYRALRRERRRRGEFTWRRMKNHLLIVNVPSQEANAYLGRLVAHVRQAPALADIPIQLLTPRYADGLPQALIDKGVTHHTGVAESTANLAAANAQHASHLLVIADEAHDARSDAHTHDVLSRLAALPGPAPAGRVVVAEVVDDDNRERIRAAGATTTLRPLRAYPEMVARALAQPGAEQVMESLFTYEADRLIRFDRRFDNLKWADVLVAFVRGNAGVPLGYARADGTVDTNPAPSQVCSGQAVIVLVDASLDVTERIVAEALAAAA